MLVCIGDDTIFSNEVCLLKHEIASIKFQYLFIGTKNWVIVIIVVILNSSKQLGLEVDVFTFNQIS